ncbi:MAG TPA: phenylalanine--tRNA ligase subunit beta [Intrasporangium sp.]|uniref:phenylalanine--tRNA ligase subunit beta n=1 Tax=Intrasporangium sp. TaxID=1925024 RepID=UPI002D774C4A|nr:phenylalanine--tRNA ligase subunit beta [Intrasporangium sp.]HET7398481.1 phenylalanine--tRNA ligase subunit beta [Intrasporangium sp.]
MRAPLTWLAEYADLAPGATGADVAASLVSVGLEEEDLHGGDIAGPLVVGRVLDFEEQVQRNGKPIRYCTVDVGEHGQRVSEGSAQEIVCGATNFAVGDLVVVALPGAVLAGGFEISSRRTYGRMSNGMICAEDEIGLGHDHAGIIVLPRLLGEEVAAGLRPGDDAVALLGLGEETVEVNVTPDRGYCFSVRGLAREYWHSQGSPPGGFRDPADVRWPPPNEGGYAVRLEDDAPLEGRPGCDRYVARIVRGIDPTRPSPPWMQRRLTQMGMRPISLAVDVTNYVMLAVGQPLHAFDVDKLSGSIVVRRARPGERLATLDDVKRELSPEDLLITDGGEHLLAIAGVMGGASSEVDDATTDVLIESAHFDPTTIARSSRRHRLVTEASKRFERGVDPQVAPAAAQLAVDLLVEFGGGTADPAVTDVDRTTPRAAYRLDVTEPTRIVGLDYPRERVVTILRDLGCTVEDDPADPQHVLVTPPSWRPDLDHDSPGPDYAEEVARIDGYNSIPSVVPTPSNGQGLTHGQRVRRTVADALAGAGFTEVLTYPFVSAELADQLQLPADDDRRAAVRLANPLSEERPLLRTSVLGTLVDALRRNVSRGFKDVALFELGLVFRPGGPLRTAPVPGIAARPDDAVLEQLYAAVPAQPRHAAVVATGLAEPAGWWGGGRPADWTDVVAAVRTVGAALAVPVVVSGDVHAPWHPGRCARVALPDGTLVGHAGELHPKVLAALELPPRTVAAEIDLDVLTAASAGPVQARSFSTYPPAHTDVALLVRRDVPAADVEAALREGAGTDLEAVALFDLYEGEHVEPGHRSLAFRLTFRAPDRTLTTEEVNGFRDAAVAAAAAATGAVQR